MSEKVWLNSTNCETVLWGLGPARTRSTRKMALFVAACCRRIWTIIPDDRLRGVVAEAERLADLQVPAAAQALAADARRAAERYVVPSSGYLGRFGRRRTHRERAAEFAALSAERTAYAIAAPTPDHVHAVVVSAARYAAGAVKFDALRRDTSGGPVATRERRAQVGLLRCAFGNPFRPCSFDPHWRTSDADDLARLIYDGRAFDRLPTLGDALLDAGCEDEEVIGHCRSGGPHLRGCWVLDLVLRLE